MNAQKMRELGSWAVVTGSSDGIGRAFAAELAHAGLNLVLVARREDRLEALAAELSGSNSSGAGIQTRICVLDLALPESAVELEKQTADLDVGMLVAAAGFGTSGNFLDTDIESELNMIDVNCRAVVAHSRIFTQRFVEKGRGALVLFSSIVAFQGVPRAANYAASKAFIQSFAEGLALELKNTGVSVLSVAPAQVQSGFGYEGHDC